MLQGAKKKKKRWGRLVYLSRELLVSGHTDVNVLLEEPATKARLL